MADVNTNDLDIMTHTFTAPATETSPVRSLTVTIPKKFAKGHVCSDGDASALNQAFKQAIQNNFRDKYREGVVVVDQAVIDEYAAKYEFSAGRTQRSPLEKKIAEYTAIAIRNAMSRGELTADSSEAEVEAYLVPKNETIKKFASDALAAEAALNF